MMRLSEEEYKRLVSRTSSLEAKPKTEKESSNPEARLLAQIQTLAKQHGWAGCHTYNPDGPDKGLHCILVREVVIFAEVCERLTPSQQSWLEALRQTGQVEVYWWTSASFTDIQARLSRQKRPNKTKMSTMTNTMPKIPLGP